MSVGGAVRRRKRQKTYTLWPRKRLANQTILMMAHISTLVIDEAFEGRRAATRSFGHGKL